MTDGIIKEVFDKHLSDNLGDYLLCKKIQRIQQELIEKIKESISDGFRCACVDTDEIKKALIGDNQE